MTPERPILVVEDHGSTRRLIGEVLEDEGWSVRLAGDGDQAISEVQRQPPSLVLLDVHLPAHPAPEVAEQLRRITGPSLPIVAMSASRERLTAALFGACAFVEKPFELDKLVAVVSDTLRSRSSDVHDRSDALRGRSERALEQLSVARERLEAAASVAQSLSEQLAAQRVLLEAMAAADARAGTLVLARTADSLEIVCAEGLSDQLVELWRHVPANAPVAIAHASKGKPVWVRSIDEGLGRYPYLAGPLSTNPWLVGLCAVPLSDEHAPTGAFGLLFDRPQQFDGRLRERLLDLGVSAAQVLSAG